MYIIEVLIITYNYSSHGCPKESSGSEWFVFASSPGHGCMHVRYTLENKSQYPDVVVNYPHGDILLPRALL